jgi:hypothetical protein
MLRGAIIESPQICEQGIDFLLSLQEDLDPTLSSTKFPFNHSTYWVGIVEGLDNLKGELFLMVISTISSEYNSTEGDGSVDAKHDYQYLEEKGIYKDSAWGLGKQTILRNDLAGIDLSQNLGAKVFGAVDLFPLKYRPLVMSKE